MNVKANEKPMLKAIGVQITDDDVVQYTLNDLPSTYESFVIAVATMISFASSFASVLSSPSKCTLLSPIGGLEAVCYAYFVKATTTTRRLGCHVYATAPIATNDLPTARSRDTKPRGEEKRRRRVKKRRRQEREVMAIGDRKEFKLVGFKNFVWTNPRSNRFDVKRFHHVEFWCRPLLLGTWYEPYRPLRPLHRQPILCLHRPSFRGPRFRLTPPPSLPPPPPPAPSLPSLALPLTASSLPMAPPINNWVRVG
ncbi:4-hydroxyphenylpyruvate dioxygenase [Nymphaea thermarum]|nr:4-hydroxyphenylpyruvate dioxygenase [Nymphaea thermarum]